MSDSLKEWKRKIDSDDEFVRLEALDSLPDGPPSDVSIILIGLLEDKSTLLTRQYITPIMPHMQSSDA
jgi:hypothetical protein